MNKRLIIYSMLLVSLASPSLSQGHPQERRKIKRPKPVKVQPKDDEIGLLDLAFFATIGGVGGVIIASAIIHVLDSRKKSSTLEDLMGKSNNHTEPQIPLNDPTPVSKQKELTCGYHALKNVIALGNENHRRLLTDQQFVERHMSNDGIWRKRIKRLAKQANNSMELDETDNHVAHNEDGVNLDAHGIQALVAECKKPYQNLLSQEDSVTVISNIGQLSENTLQSLQKPGMHRVILRVDYGVGHWIAAVINQTEAGTNYEWADSIDGKYYPELARLIQQVTHPAQEAQKQTA